MFLARVVFRAVMSWRDLLQEENDSRVFPWCGGRVLTDATHAKWNIMGNLPRDYGWYRFALRGRQATVEIVADPAVDSLIHRKCGYLVGNRLVPDGVRVDPDPRAFVANGLPEVYLVDDGLDRFVRVQVGKVHEDGPHIFCGLEFPLGPEEEVLGAFLDQAASVDHIAGVTPALDAAFRMETFQRAEAERRRQEEARRLREEEERRAQEERRRQLVEQLGDGAGRRAMAREDFAQAARAALAIGGAELLDTRRAVARHEMVIRFRLDGQRFECTCNEHTLRIIDAGICLVAHYDDPDFEHGERGDTLFTLESLPGVIRQAIREGVLHRFRHVN